MSLERPIEARQEWMGVLARASREQLERCWKEASTDAPLVELKPPETGLVMVRARSGGNGPQFNMGEMTVTRCILRGPHGVLGHAYVAGRDHRHARLAAAFDALLQLPEHHAAIMDRVVAPLAAEQRQRRAARWAAASRTKVEFLTVAREAR